MTLTTPKKFRKRSKIEKLQLENLAQMEQNNEILDELKRKKRPTWLTITLEVIRIIVAALAGGTGATIL